MIYLKQSCLPVGLLMQENLSGMGAAATHYEGKELSPYVGEVSRRSKEEIQSYYEKIERAKIKKEKYKETKTRFKEILKSNPSEEIIVSKEDLKILLSPPK